MIIKDIIRKEELTTEEMIFVVEEYIFLMKDKRISINLLKKFENIPKQFWNHFLIPQLQMLDSAYQDACIYFFKEKY